MAYRSYRKKATSRRSYATKRKSYSRYSRKRMSRPSVVRVKGPAGTVFADRYFTKLRYMSVGSFDAGISDYFQFTQNGMFDPEYATGGGQPMGFDQLSSLYLKNRVHASKITISCTNLSAVPAICVVYPLTTASVPNSIEADSEQRYSRRATIASVNGGKANIVLKNSIMTKKLWGMQSITQDDLFTSSNASNPTNLGIWNVSAYSLDGLTSLNCAYQIMIEYACEFYDPVRLARS